MCATSAMLCLHHFFAVWNGDRRLRDKWGEKADTIQERTSILPFAAIASGKQGEKLLKSRFKDFVLHKNISVYYITLSFDFKLTQRFLFFSSVDDIAIEEHNRY